jgi:Leucine-rich repeat (LRR) protein
MSCKGRTSRVGLIILFDERVTTVAFHGWPDSEYLERIQQYHFGLDKPHSLMLHNTNEVITNLANRDLPPAVRGAMLYNLAINGVSGSVIDPYMLEGEDVEYKRLESIQEVLALTDEDWDCTTDPKKVKRLSFRGVAPTRGLGEFVNVEQLDLVECGLASVPPEVWDMNSLKFLNLRGNRLESLPPEIGQLVNLVELRLGDNQLTDLPVEIGDLGNLRSCTYPTIAFPHYHPCPTAITQRKITAETSLTSSRGREIWQSAA